MLEERAREHEAPSPSPSHSAPVPALAVFAHVSPSPPPGEAHRDCRQAHMEAQWQAERPILHRPGSPNQIDRIEAGLTKLQVGQVVAAAREHGTHWRDLA